MNMHLYPKLAWHGIIKNKKTYVPFLLTSIGLVMMFSSCPISPTTNPSNRCVAAVICS